jgi:hypothetical protein
MSNAAQDEARFLARAGVALATVVSGAGIVVGVAFTVPAAVLVFASGALLGAVLLGWSSLRTLAGDAELTWEAELEDDMPPGGDVFARKNMLLRALRDLEQEHAIGRLSEDDFVTSREQYRTELRRVLEASDWLLAPHRDAAERLLSEYRQAHKESPT